MRNENCENIRQTFDDIIKKSVEMEMTDSLSPLTDEDIKKMGYPSPPADMYDKIMKECTNATINLDDGFDKKPNNSKKHKLHKFIVIAAAILILSCGAFSVGAVRVYVFKIIHQITENSIQFFGINDGSYNYDADENEAYNNADKALGYTTLKPKYMPDGYVFDSVKLYENDHVIMVYKNQDKIIKLTQELKTDPTYSGEAVDTKEGYTYTLTVKNTIINIAEHKQLDTDIKWYSAIWNDENLIYNVSSNCNKKEFEKFIKSLY
ncbi:DUF4367 domain-containing protein [Qingrenia yutianensis]|uniref:DUF4367 domain-containing protein n=1 Tax=Qingrenia yutianensis TaxID=2763676 RepID=A0A926FEV6_9FIRM|nr:DUF4367 domain-containing protein [Qingrenia yutianensis]MBC8597442.1 DUF4367 domain-containing protein [Qingrenia yutianensis]